MQRSVEIRINQLMQTRVLEWAIRPDVMEGHYCPSIDLQPSKTRGYLFIDQLSSEFPADSCKRNPEIVRSHQC